MVFPLLIFFTPPSILLIQWGLQKTMRAVGTDAFVKTSKQRFQHTSILDQFCFQNKETGCSHEPNLSLNDFYNGTELRGAPAMPDSIQAFHVAVA